MNARGARVNQRGALSIVAACGALTFCLVALGAADLGAMLIARSRAQAAADAAALAAAVAMVPVLRQGDDPEAQARALAEANGATLVRCDCPVGETTATVEVAVRARAWFVPAWVGRSARATASAQVDPDVLSYRDDG